MNVSEFLKDIRKTSKGQGLVEYALIITLVALAVIAALGAIKVPLEKIFTSVKW